MLATIRVNARDNLLAEIHESHPVLTPDSDFTVYRKHRPMPITLVHPV